MLFTYSLRKKTYGSRGIQVIKTILNLCLQAGLPAGNRSRGMPFQLLE